MTLFVPPNVPALDTNGNPLSGALWYFYLTGTTTPVDVYTSATLATAHANPVVADSAGRFPPIYRSPDVTYRGVLKTATGTTIADYDPVAAPPWIGADKVGYETGTVEGELDLVR